MLCAGKKEAPQEGEPGASVSTWSSTNSADCDSAQAAKQKSDTAKIARTVADYVRVLAAPVLVVADPEVLRHSRLAGLQGKFHTAAPNLDAVCEAAERHAVRTVIVTDEAALDLEEVRRKAKCFVVPLRGAK